ncbi:hypothetical protein INR49_008403, partial [Caranx melampygus]
LSSFHLLHSRSRTWFSCCHASLVLNGSGPTPSVSSLEAWCCCSLLLLGLFGNIFPYTHMASMRRTLFQVVKMLRWLFTATVLLSFMKQADAQGRCNNVQAADIVFLVDGSSSIGRAKLPAGEGFISGVIKPFASSVSETGIRFGAIQYVTPPGD